MNCFEVMGYVAGESIYYQLRDRLSQRSSTRFLLMVSFGERSESTTAPGVQDAVLKCILESMR